MVLLILLINCLVFLIISGGLYFICSPFSLPNMIWTQFSKAFLERFMPYNLRVQIRDEFDILE